MDITELADHLRRAECWLAGKTVRLDFGPAGTILLDGVAAAVDIDADCAAAEQVDASIAIAWRDWLAIGEGSLDPMRAYLGGQLRIAGNLGAAMQLAAILGRLRG